MKNAFNLQTIWSSTKAFLKTAGVAAGAGCAEGGLYGLYLGAVGAPETFGLSSLALGGAGCLFGAAVGFQVTVMSELYAALIWRALEVGEVAVHALLSKNLEQRISAHRAIRQGTQLAIEVAGAKAVGSGLRSAGSRVVTALEKTGSSSTVNVQATTPSTSSPWKSGEIKVDPKAGTVTVALSTVRRPKPNSASGAAPNGSTTGGTRSSSPVQGQSNPQLGNPNSRGVGTNSLTGKMRVSLSTREAKGGRGNGFSPSADVSSTSSSVSVGLSSAYSSSQTAILEAPGASARQTASSGAQPRYQTEVSPVAPKPVVSGAPQPYMGTLGLTFEKPEYVINPYTLTEDDPRRQQAFEKWRSLRPAVGSNDPVASASSNNGGSKPSGGNESEQDIRNDQSQPSRKRLASTDSTSPGKPPGFGDLIYPVMRVFDDGFSPRAPAESGPFSFTNKHGKVIEVDRVKHPYFVAVMEAATAIFQRWESLASRKGSAVPPPAKLEEIALMLVQVEGREETSSKLQMADFKADGELFEVAFPYLGKLEGIQSASAIHFGRPSIVQLRSVAHLTSQRIISVGSGKGLDELALQIIKQDPDTVIGVDNNSYGMSANGGALVPTRIQEARDLTLEGSDVVVLFSPQDPEVARTWSSEGDRARPVGGVRTPIFADTLSAVERAGCSYLALIPGGCFGNHSQIRGPHPLLLELFETMKKRWTVPSVVPGVQSEFRERANWGDALIIFERRK